ncbi:MAG: orotidine-5'-phosphate decarboxylase [Cyanothece sp. SIO2G6]|nr:orotidine-5'-phosphate decarboxylase [Cyanothece sp. SIO2G6]
MNPVERIIVPLDVATEAAAIALLDQLPQVTFWKVGLELFVACGPAILHQLRQRHKRIFLDLKFHDIPNTMAGACRSAARYGVDLLTVHGAAGKDALAAAQTAAEQEATAQGLAVPKLLAITVLTSLTSRAVAFDLKVPIELPEYVLHLALLAQKAGIPGVVCSPQEASEVRRVCGNDFTLVCPGVRPTWAASGDQRRSLTPAAALDAGADYLVIGRPITTAPDPAIAFNRICAEIA